MAMLNNQRVITGILEQPPKKMEKLEALKFMGGSIESIPSWKNCSLQTLGLPAANPAYPLTCSNPCVGFEFVPFQNSKP